jgi:hypothetical protein
MKPSWTEMNSLLPWIDPEKNVSPCCRRLRRAEAGQREGHRVEARAQIRELELAGSIGRHRANALDERGARRLDCHARQDPAGGVGHRSGNARGAELGLGGMHRDRGQDAENDCSNREHARGHWGLK